MLRINFPFPLVFFLGFFHSGLSLSGITLSSNDKIQFTHTDILSPLLFVPILTCMYWLRLWV